MSAPLTGEAARAALPALDGLDFPCALVVTENGQVVAAAGEVEETFPFASVTKPIAVWSALIAVDRGLMSLDDPAGEQLPGATVRDLMSHSSGISFDGADGADTVLGPPRKRRVYSNRGIEILGQRLEEATGTDLEEWIETTVLEPLGMASVLVPGSPAHSGSGNARDLSLFARELAAPTLVSAGLAEQARHVVHPGLDGVLPGYGRQTPNDFGLGVSIRGHKHPHWTGERNSPETFGHFGQSGSFLWVDPVAGREAVFLGAKPFSKAHKAAWPALNDQVLAL